MTDEELIARLRDAPADGLGTENRCIAAAARLAALAKRLEIAVDVVAESGRLRGQAEARAERLEAAASSVADDVCSYICPSVGRAGEPILHDPRCIALRAALKGADHV